MIVAVSSIYVYPVKLSGGHLFNRVSFSTEKVLRIILQRRTSILGQSLPYPIIISSNSYTVVHTEASLSPSRRLIRARGRPVGFRLRFQPVGPTPRRECLQLISLLIKSSPIFPSSLSITESSSAQAYRHWHGRPPQGASSQPLALRRRFQSLQKVHRRLWHEPR